MKQLVIFGAGDLAEVAAVYFARDSDYTVAAFTVDDAYITGESFLDLPLIPFSTLGRVFPPDSCEMFVAMGFKRLNRNRADAYTRCKTNGYRLATYVSSGVTEWGNWTAGDNCFILAQNEIQPFVRIGDDVTIWSGNHIGHHSRVGDHCFISSHVVLSGKTEVGEYCYLGINSSVKHGVKIAPRCLIGAGALILQNTSEGQLYAVEGTRASSVPAERAARLL